MAKTPEITWTLTPHVCRACFGRVVMRVTDDFKRVYRCSNCGIERDGQNEKTICCCGIKLRHGRDVMMRCQPNPAPTPECPSEIIAISVDQK